jgi:hypothetical protein
MAAGIHKYPLRRQGLPYPASLYCPFSKMVLKNSPNLLTNGSFDTDVSGWSPGNDAVITSEATIKVSGKSAKVTWTREWSGFTQSIITTKYQGITGTAKGYVRVSSLNETNATRMFLQDYDAGGNHTTSISAVIPRDDAWYFKTVNLRFQTDENRVVVGLDGNESATPPSGIDTAYFDEFELTVPQISDRTGHILHPDITSMTGLGAYGDATDDLITVESAVGSDVIGTGNVTVCATINPLSQSVYVSDRILDNGKFLLYYAATSCLGMSSDGGVTVVKTAANSITQNKKNRIVVTRAADGTINAYINNALSGSSDQASGTPASGTTLLTMLNRLSGDRGLNGYLDDVIIYPRIFTKADRDNDYAMFGGR